MEEYWTLQVPLRLFENGWELVTAIDTSARFSKGPLSDPKGPKDPAIRYSGLG